MHPSSDDLTRCSNYFILKFNLSLQNCNLAWADTSCKNELSVSSRPIKSALATESTFVWNSNSTCLLSDAYLCVLSSVQITALIYSALNCDHIKLNTFESHKIDANMYSAKMFNSIGCFVEF